jgi:Mce-associated membrane protein
VIRLSRRTRQPTEQTLDDVLVLPSSEADADSAPTADEGAQGSIDESNGACAHDGASTTQKAVSKQNRLRRALVFGLLPGLAMLLAGAVGYLKWQSATLAETQTARAESVQAATAGTIAILSYNPDTVDHDVEAARGELTGNFRDAYSHLTHDLVIPTAKQKRISAVATVPAAASISASPDHAVVIVFINQTTIQGNDPPSATASTVRVTLDNHDNRWLISDFTPI